MKAILTILAMTLATPVAAFADFRETETPRLICASYFYSEAGVGCVSKVSIEKDKMELEVLRLQLQELKEKAAERALAKSKAEEAEKAAALKKLSPKERKQLGLSK